MTTPVSDSSGNPLVANSSTMSYNDIISSYLNQWGMSDLIPVVTQLGATGASSDQINLTLQQTPEWQQRFAGNAGREAMGLAPLDPATYLGLEDQYQQIASAYNLPAGFVSQDLMNQWIGGDVSASEVSDRVKAANDIVTNQSTADAYQQFGYSTGDITAAVLDPGTAQSVIDQRESTAQIGGAAIQNGLTANLASASQAYQNGVTLDQARSAYSQIAQNLPTDSQIAGRFGQQFGQTDEENATLLNQADAQRQQASLHASETSLFSGHGGASDTSNDAGSNY